MKECMAFDVYSVSVEVLHRVCPDEMAAMEALMTFEAGWGQFAKCMCEPLIYGELEESFPEPASVEALIRCFERLTQAFEERTGLGLDVEFCEELDQYDGPHIDGCVFILHGITQLTPAAEKMKEDFGHYGWVVVDWD